MHQREATVSAGSETRIDPNGCAQNTPFTHHVKTTPDAAAFVIEVGNPNGVLLLDIWHAYRGGTPYATLPALVPPEIVFGVELDDGLAEW